MYTKNMKIIAGEAQAEMKKMDDGSVDLIVTDPPYGTDYQSNRQGVDRKQSIATRTDVVVRPKFFDKIKNDNAVPLEWLVEAFRVLKLNAAIYVFCHWSKFHILLPAVEEVGFTPKNLIVLNKSNHGMGDLQGQYAPKHEFLLFAVKGRHLLRFPSGRAKDVWDVPVKFSGAHRRHPNEKPKSWSSQAIENSSDVGDLVLDPFCGSGSFLEEAERLGRQALGIEIEGEKYRTETVSALVLPL